MPYSDIAKEAKCTTCHFKEDLVRIPDRISQVYLLNGLQSNYWTANLYFKARNGTYKRVPQIANEFNDGNATTEYWAHGN